MADEWLRTQRNAATSVRWVLGSPYGTGNKIHLCKLGFFIDPNYYSHNSILRLSLFYSEELEGERSRLQEDLNQTEPDEEGRGVRVARRQQGAVRAQRDGGEGGAHGNRWIICI